MVLSKADKDSKQKDVKRIREEIKNINSYIESMFIICDISHLNRNKKSHLNIQMKLIKKKIEEAKNEVKSKKCDLPNDELYQELCDTYELLKTSKEQVEIWNGEQEKKQEELQIIEKELRKVQGFDEMEEQLEELISNPLINLGDLVKMEHNTLGIHLDVLQKITEAVPSTRLNDTKESVTNIKENLVKKV